MSSVYASEYRGDSRKKSKTSERLLIGKKRVRTFLKERVREERIKNQLEAACKNKQRMKATLDVAELIREDRESLH